LVIEGNDLQILSFEDNSSRYLDELVRLDELCLSGYGEVWTKKNFVWDMPQKGQLSKLATSNGKLIGYIICSSATGSGHIHRFAVSLVYQQGGIGARLLAEFVRECRASGIGKVTVETQTANTDAIAFYERLGFHRLEDQPLRDYLRKKGKLGQIKDYVGQAATSVVYLAAAAELNKVVGMGE